jgi:hypothetical protein
MDTTMDPNKELYLKAKLILSNTLGREVSDSDIQECYQSLYFLGKAIARFHAPKYGKRKAN